MEWRLGDETIRKWYAKDTGDTCSESQEEKVPMEPSWFSKRKFSALSD
jgi:hypothetical protein